MNLSPLTISAVTSNRYARVGYYRHYCPVCEDECESTYDAADCCLWRDLDHTTRHQIAERVEKGSTWAKELQP